MKFKLVVISLLFIILTTTGLGCRGGDTTAKQALLEPVTLNFWGAFDSSDSFEKIIASYKKSHPNVTINYKKIRFEEYEQKMLEGWASGTGPDVFAIGNNWVGKYQDKITPLPATLKIPATETVSSFFNKETQAIIQETTSPTPNQIRSIFPEVVYKDVVRNNQIYGLPLSVDTLVLFYNRDHLNAAGLIQPPLTWQEFSDNVKKLTKINSKGDFERLGAAMGGATNINRSNDILSLLMMQNGTTMVDSQNKVSFANKSSYDSENSPGEQALMYYTQFAMPSQSVYTWNNSQPEAFELFTSGKLSFMFGYSYQIPLLKAQAPKISFGITGVPHIKTDGTDAFGAPINFAGYWLYTVFKNSAHPNEAWDFLLFLTTKQYQDANGQARYYAEDYLDIAKTPPALKSLINNYKIKNPELAAFAEQILTADSWYRGKNIDEANRIFKQMINKILLGTANFTRAIYDAAAAIQDSY